VAKIKYPGCILLLFLSSCKTSSTTEKIRDGDWATKVTVSSFYNLYKINDSIYRSEQPANKAIAFIDSSGIKSILNLRQKKDNPGLLNMHSVKSYHIKMVTKNFTDAEIIQSLLIIKNAPKPLLVHCKHGADRTGVVIAMYRIIFQNWSKEKALEELKDGHYGFHTMYKNIPLYLKTVDTGFIKKSVLSQN
jgi:tyrosine-protein phosphatase SIW14